MESCRPWEISRGVGNEKHLPVADSAGVSVSYLCKVEVFNCCELVVGFVSGPRSCPAVELPAWFSPVPGSRASPTCTATSTTVSLVQLSLGTSVSMASPAPVLPLLASWL